jgi:hypothetical protein
MLSYPVILAVSAVGLVLTAIIVGLVSGSWIASLVVVALAAAVIYIMMSFQTVSVTQKEDGMDIDVDPIPGPSQNEPSMFAIKEVFHISGNNYTYDDAPAVCGAYGAELASYDQITDAQVQGAEWCGYGWSAAGMALYPTQQATWEALQRDPKERKRTACGHPGVNGGYFDPRLKFGVNCYGRKPPNMGTKLPRPLPGTDEEGFEKMVNKFKAMLTSMKLSPFNRDIWSKTGYGNTSSVPVAAPSSVPVAGPPPSLPKYDSVQSTGYKPVLLGQTMKPESQPKPTTTTTEPQNQVILDQPLPKSFYDRFTDLFN